MAEQYIPDTPVLRLVDRLRGIYTVAVNDSAGLLEGKNTFTPDEPYFTPPIQKEAALHIENLEEALRQCNIENKNLKEGLKEILIWIDNWDPNFIHDSEWADAREKVDKLIK